MGDLSSIPGLEKSHGGGHGNPVQFSCLENPHGQRSLVDCNLWGRKESDKAEWLSTVHSTELCYRKALSGQVLSLVPKLILFFGDHESDTMYCKLSLVFNEPMSIKLQLYIYEGRSILISDIFITKTNKTQGNTRKKGGVGYELSRWRCCIMAVGICPDSSICTL